MELEEFSKDYQNLGHRQKDRSALERMLTDGRHPVLRRMRRQLLLETLAWTILLAVFYGAFDGAAKPVFWTGLLVLAIVLILVHNVLGLRLVRHPVRGSDLRSSLAQLLRRLWRYASLSIFSRGIAIVALFAFFLAGVPEWEARHYWSLAGVVLILGIQLWGLWGIWSRRIQQVRASYEQLGEPGTPAGNPG